MNRYARKKDRNHREIAELLDDIGVPYVDTAAYGMSLDFIVAWRGIPQLWEIKDGLKCPSARTLTKKERLLHSDMARQNVKVHLVESRDDAYRLLGIVTTS